MLRPCDGKAGLERGKIIATGCKLELMDNQALCSFALPCDYFGIKTDVNDLSVMTSRTNTRLHRSRDIKKHSVLPYQLSARTPRTGYDLGNLNKPFPLLLVLLWIPFTIDMAKRTQYWLLTRFHESLACAVFS